MKFFIFLQVDRIPIWGNERRKFETRKIHQEPKKQFENEEKTDRSQRKPNRQLFLGNTDKTGKKVFKTIIK